MITKEDFLNAKELIKNYKIQEGKKKYIKKVDLFLSNSSEKTILLLKDKFSTNKTIRYKDVVSIISDVYFEVYNKNLGTNNSKIILKKLIQDKIILSEGDVKFREYKINLNNGE